MVVMASLSRGRIQRPQPPAGAAAPGGAAPAPSPAGPGDASPGAEAWRLMFELLRSEKPRFQAVAAEFELSPMQAHVLRLLEPGRPVPMSSVAEGLACDASNVTGIVDRLEELGLIERRGAPHDRRVKMLFVTEEGARLRGELAKRVFAPPPSIAGLPASDQRALREVLRRALGRS